MTWLSLSNIFLTRLNRQIKITKKDSTIATTRSIPVIESIENGKAIIHITKQHTFTFHFQSPNFYQITQPSNSWQPLSLRNNLPKREHKKTLSPPVCIKRVDAGG